MDFNVAAEISTDGNAGCLLGDFMASMSLNKTWLRSGRHWLMKAEAETWPARERSCASISITESPDLYFLKSSQNGENGHLHEFFMGNMKCLANLASICNIHDFIKVVKMDCKMPKMDDALQRLRLVVVVLSVWWFWSWTPSKTRVQCFAHWSCLYPLLAAICEAAHRELSHFLCDHGCCAISSIRIQKTIRSKWFYVCFKSNLLQSK